MKTIHFPIVGLLLVASAVAAALVPGLLNGNGGAIAEAVELEDGGVATIDEVLIGAQVQEEVANCRYGVATKDYTDHQKWVDDLGAGWWMNFKVNYEAPAENGAEFAHVIYIKQQRDAQGNHIDAYTISPRMDNNSLGYLIQARPGRLWIVGNEVDRGPNPGEINGGQGDTLPEKYAQIYHDVYHYIKAWDPAALVTPSAMVEITPGRIQYLDKMWDAYLALYGRTMPADLWNMHLYIFPELLPDGSPSYSAGVAVGTDPELGIYDSGGDPAECARDDVYCLAEHDDLDAFAEQVVRMRTWMKAHGQQDKPLLITEYSILHPYEEGPEGCSVKDEFGNCFTPQRVGEFAAASFNYMENASDPNLGYPRDNNRLVQQWLWFGLYRTGVGKASNLTVSGDQLLPLTPAGQEFYDATRAEPPAVNLFPDKVMNPTSPIAGGLVSAELAVAIRNNGNTRVNQPFNVTFYRDAALTDVIGTATVPAPDSDFLGMTGCATRHIWVTALWEENLAPGEHPFWVKVDSGGVVGESDEGDNVATGLLLVVPGGTFLPLVVR